MLLSSRGNCDLNGGGCEGDATVERKNKSVACYFNKAPRSQFVFIKWVGGWRWLFIGGHIIILLLLLGETPKLLLYCNRLLFSYGDFFFASVKDMTLLETPQRRDEKRYIKCLGHVVVYKERFY